MSLLGLERKRLIDLEGDPAVVKEILDALTTAKAVITKMIDTAMVSTHLLASQYAKFTDFLSFDVAKSLHELLIRNLEGLSSQEHLSEICKQIRRFHVLNYQLDKISFDSVAFPLVCVNTLLKQRALVMPDALIDSIVKDSREKNMEITVRYEAILRRIQEKPTNEAQLAKLKEFVAESKKTIAGMILEADVVHKRLDALHEFSCKLSIEDFKLAYSTKEWPLRVAQAADSFDSTLEEDKIRMMDKLSLEKEAFEVDLERFEQDVRSFQSYGGIDKTEKYVELAVNLFDGLQDAKAKAL